MKTASKYLSALSLALILASLVGTRPVHAQGRYLYWIGGLHAEDARGNAIFRYKLDNGVVDTLLQAEQLNPNSELPRHFFHIAVDTLRGHLYWTNSEDIKPDGTVMGGPLRRATLQGSSPEVILESLACGLGGPTDIAIDATRQILYWSAYSDCSDSALRGLITTNTNPVELIHLPVSGKYHGVASIAIDANNNILYWTNNELSGSAQLGIYRARLSDTTTDEFLVQGSICDIALAPMLSKIYWTPCDSRLIRRANLDGSGAEDVFVSQAEIGKLAISHAERKIYWSETTAGKIRRANLDGNGVEDLLTGLVVPGSLDFGGRVSVAVAPPAGLPERVGLRSVYPNPVRERATLTFTLAEAARVTLEIYDQLGRRVETLSSERYPPGTFRVQWKPGDQANGVYFCRLLVGNRSETIALVLRR